MPTEQDESKTLPKSVTSTEPYANVTESKSIDFTSINEILLKVFKHDGFRTQLQRDAIMEACKFERDLFVSLPTGSGKSLIYQLPALFNNHGLAIIVSPLVALISNQISNAHKLGIPCATINSHMTKTWNTQVKTELKNKDTKLRLLYITPETLCSDHFQPYLTLMNKKKTLKLFAIDEAHCVSSWGHEFRPDYLKLGQLRRSYPNVPIIALTATATGKVLTDILNVLNLREPKKIIASAFRENLFYDVIHTDKLEKGVINDLSEFVMDCLKLDPLVSKKRKSHGGNPNLKKKSAKHAPETVIDSKNLTITSKSSQFMSAADLFAVESLLPPITEKGEKKVRAKKSPPVIMVPEVAKITSFFKTKTEADLVKAKAKSIEVIDLCDSDEEGTQDTRTKVGLQKPPQALKKPIKNSVEIDPFEMAHQPPVKKSLGVGIIYCRTKVNCEDVAAQLSMKGIPARPYHSGLNNKERAEIEKLWMEERVLVICATISFGMGIDKPNVRVVVHFNMSQSLANYYQESGRAGRDGKEAYCRLYYSQTDQSAITFLLKKDMEMENNVDKTEALGVDVCKRKAITARAAMERFDKMVEYCRMSNRCRHLVLAREFALGDKSLGRLVNGCGKSCDYCRKRARLHF